MRFPEPFETVMGHVATFDSDQLRSLIAHCAGLHAQKEGLPLTVESLFRITTRLEAMTTVERMSLITLKVARKHGLTERDLRSKSRAHEIAHARQEAMYLMRLVMKEDGQHRFSLPRIASFFELDHTTVLFGIRAHKRRLAERDLAGGREP